MRSAAEETERLTRLAEDLLLIARADQGALPIRREPIPTRGGARAGGRPIRDAREQLGRSVRIEDADARVDADRTGVEQALGNLVDNALVHGGGTVELCADERDDVVELHVATTGRASRRTSPRARSTASAAPTRRAAAAAPGSASRSSS